MPILTVSLCSTHAYHLVDFHLFKFASSRSRAAPGGIYKACRCGSLLDEVFGHVNLALMSATHFLKFGKSVQNFLTFLAYCAPIFTWSRQSVPDLISSTFSVSLFLSIWFSPGLFFVVYGCDGVWDILILLLPLLAGDFYSLVHLDHDCQYVGSHAD